MTDRTIAAQIEELRQLSGPKLRERYEELFGHPARLRNKKWLFKRCAWKTQERHYGGLNPDAQKKLEDLIDKVEFPMGKRRTTSRKTRMRGKHDLSLGTVITRDYKGDEIRVQVVENGFEWNGVVFRSLTAVAQAVTGSKWNGKLFFGITKRKQRS